MPFLQRREISCDPATRACALPNLWGDLVCPGCGCQIITPPGFDVSPGWGRCPRCHTPFRVGAATAAVCNARTRQHAEGVR